jgi:hypothetical protein
VQPCWVYASCAESAVNLEHGQYGAGLFGRELEAWLPGY